MRFKLLLIEEEGLPYVAIYYRLDLLNEVRWYARGVNAVSIDGVHSARYMYYSAVLQQHINEKQEDN